jgi:hypothetical protein
MDKYDPTRKEIKDITKPPKLSLFQKLKMEIFGEPTIVIYGNVYGFDKR